MNDTTTDLAEHGPRLHRLLVRLTLREDVAEDLLQELFLKLSRHAGFRRAEDPLGYAMRSATNLAFDWRRARARAPATETADEQLPCPSGPSPLGAMVQREQLQTVLDAIGRLSQQNRDIVVMRYLEQQPYEQIAAAVGKTPHQVRGLCHKALDRLRRTLGDAQPSSDQQKPRS